MRIMADQKLVSRLGLALLGFSLPVAILWTWKKSRTLQHKKHKEHLQELAVEESFPASDPPASW
jgi:hypothetical protein